MNVDLCWVSLEKEILVKRHILIIFGTINSTCHHCLDEMHITAKFNR